MSILPTHHEKLPESTALELTELLASVPRPGSGISRNSSGASFTSEQPRLTRRESEQLLGSNAFTPTVEESCIPLPLVPALLQQLLHYTVDWALLHGMVVSLSERSKATLQHVPFALLPTPFPASSFRVAVSTQQQLNTLLLHTRTDKEFLISSLAPLVDKDEFTNKLLRIFRAVENEGRAHNLSLSLHRSDFVLHLPTAATFPDLRLASLQTMAVSFAAFGPLLTDMHRHVLSRFSLCVMQPGSIPVNACLDNVVDIFARALAAYCSLCGLAGQSGAVSLLMVENAAEDPSALESRIIEHLLWDKHRIAVLRKTFAQVHQESDLRPDRSLHVDDREIGLVFYRTGSRLSDYTSASDWSARLLLERSRAINCPSVGDQLSGHRHIQHVLIQPGVLESRVGARLDAAAVGQLKGVFSSFHSLAKGGCDVALKLLGEAPDEYLLQTSLNFGGSLLNSDFADSLHTLPEDQRAYYVLVERARPPMCRNYSVQGGHVTLGNVVSELGVFGAVLADGDRPLDSRVLGHVLRTKMTDEDGGMSAGLAVLDSPFLS